jgi:hypothetical protein
MNGKQRVQLHVPKQAEKCNSRPVTHPRLWKTWERVSGIESPPAAGDDPANLSPPPTGTLRRLVLWAMQTASTGKHVIIVYKTLDTPMNLVPGLETPDYHYHWTVNFHMGRHGHAHVHVSVGGIKSYCFDRLF